MVLYGNRRTRAFRCFWMLEELGVKYESHDIDFSKGEHRSKEYLKISPTGKVPALVDGDISLFESAAIMTYLGDKHPDKNLVPKAGTAERGHYNQWMFYCMSELEQPLWTKAKHKFAIPREFRREGMAETAAYEFQRAQKVVADHLSDREYLVGNRFTAADILVGQTLMWARSVDLPIPERHMQEYIGRLRDRMGFKNAKSPGK